MKHGLRICHRWLLLVLVIVLPLLVIAGVRARRAPAVMEQIPEPIARQLAP
ncbi:MAG: hypothetical protein O3B24_04925 [Verrucomicrobia bacterium]|nr:hypothetical protein [Verrucomicrobiota bacterium]